MIVYVLIREDQKEHGFVDASIDGVFGDERVAVRVGGGLPSHSHLLQPVQPEQDA